MGKGDGSDVMEVLMEIAALPHVGEQTTVVAAEPDAVWRGLSRVMGHSSAQATLYARLVRAADRESAGPRPLAEGSAIAGFHVTSAVPGRELVMEGSHRFSSYALVFHVERTGPGRSLLRAETRAAFPGLAGGLYRRLVISSGGHVIAVRRLLSAVRRRSE